MKSHQPKLTLYRFRGVSIDTNTLLNIYKLRHLLLKLRGDIQATRAVFTIDYQPDKTPVSPPTGTGTHLKHLEEC